MMKRIFNQLGSEKLCGEEGLQLESKFRTLGEKAYSCLEKVQEFGLYATLLGSYPRLGIKVNCYLIDFQVLR